MTKNKFNEISVIIPVYKEEKRLKQSLPKIVKYLNDNFSRFEIIIALDPPKGNTEQIAKDIYKDIILIESNKNMGKGYSVKQGIVAAKYEIILFVDVDLSTPIEEIGRFMPYLNTHQVIIGSRNLKDSKITKRQPLLRSTLGNIFPLFVRFLIIKDIKDTQCGFKMFKKETIRPIFSKQKIDGFAFDAELLLIAKKKGYKIKEIPIEWTNSDESRLNVFKDSIRMGIEITKIFINNKRGYYNGN
ncbi:MAG: glycosyltransferase [Nanohaloarchaea archaeon]|nr:glycosyltransferase [Candidatus Nanohaloarchaea archaeon]